MAAKKEELVGRAIDDLDIARHEEVEFKLKLSFDFEELTCWREIVVPGGYTFYDLHFIIQTMFNWLDYHLYDFQMTHKGEKLLLAENSGASEDFWGDMCVDQGMREIDLEQVRLDDIFPETKSVRYSYDYGDGWEIEIEVLGVETNELLGIPRCIAGDGDCPPDDVGGEGGFIRFLEAVGDKADPDHDQMVDWGRSQGYKPFDLEKTNKTVSKWRANQKAHNRNRDAG